ncbi:unnamed protein product [Cunninghamella blakesleeana]
MNESCQAAVGEYEKHFTLAPSQSNEHEIPTAKRKQKTKNYYGCENGKIVILSNNENNNNGKEENEYDAYNEKKDMIGYIQEVNNNIQHLKIYNDMLEIIIHLQAENEE